MVGGSSRQPFHPTAILLLLVLLLLVMQHARADSSPLDTSSSKAAVQKTDSDSAYAAIKASETAAAADGCATIPGCLKCMNWGGQFVCVECDRAAGYRLMTRTLLCGECCKGCFPSLSCFAVGSCDGQGCIILDHAPH